MYSYTPGGTRLALASYGDEDPRRDRREFYFGADADYRVVKDEATEEDEEPVSALDLRIGKATESISIFDDKNVLASTSSGFGPAFPRAGQARISAASPSPSPYTLPPRHRLSTSSFAEMSPAESRCQCCP
jgi:hypothetical protein